MNLREVLTDMLMEKAGHVSMPGNQNLDTFKDVGKDLMQALLDSGHGFTVDDLRQQTQDSINAGRGDELTAAIMRDCTIAGALHELRLLHMAIGFFEVMRKGIDGISRATMRAIFEKVKAGESMPEKFAMISIAPDKETCTYSFWRGMADRFNEVSERFVIECKKENEYKECDCPVCVAKRAAAAAKPQEPKQPEPAAAG